MIEQEEKAGSASEYRKIAAAKRAKKETFMVPVPSGFTWELQRPDLEGYIMTGRVPETLVNQFLTSAISRGIIPGEVQSQMQATVDRIKKIPLNPQETMAGLIFVRELVREACVNPRIVVGGVGEDEIDPSEVDPDDFKFIMSWCLGYEGVTGLDGLKSFRGGRKGRAPNARAGRKKFRRATVKSG